MKRLLILVLILIGIIMIPLVSSPDRYLFFRSMHMNNTKNAQESINFDRWEYVKSRLFPIGGKVVPKFQGPILVSLEEANEEQKGLVKESIDSINKMIKNKRVHLYEEYTGYTPQYIIDSAANTTSNNQMFYLYANSISISFAEKPSSNTDYITPRNISFPKLNTSILSDSTVIQRNNYYYSPIDEINGAILNFNFSDRTKIERKRRYILYELMRSLCYLSKENNERSFIDKSPIARLNSFQYRYARKNWVFSNTFYTPEDYEITAYDTFLLEKLYSDDFFLQFQNHLEYYYPYLYIYNFYYSGYVKLFSEVLIVILGTFLFMFSLSIFHQRKFKFSFLNYLIPILIINTSLLGLLNLKNFLQLDVFAFVSMRVFTFSLIINIFLVSILQGFTIWLIERVLMKKLKGFTLNLLLKFSITLIAFMVPFMFLNPRMYGYTTNIFVISLAIAISRGLYIYLNHYSASITRKKDLEISQLKELQLATELNSLHAQINPHFLYNALNSIASLSKIDGNKTEKMALSLSDLFRYSVNRKGEKMSSIQEEVDMVENYLQIEKIRFEDRLEYSIKVDDSLQKLEIPRFILQPLIENAIKHGISKIEEKGFISLEIYLENKKLIVAVSDNGPDFPEGLISGHGLQSVFDLLRLSYGELASMNWENLPKKKITIIINSNS